MFDCEEGSRGRWSAYHAYAVYARIVRMGPLAHRGSYVSSCAGEDALETRVQYKNKKKFACGELE